jgi:hypothetical protein
MRTRTLMIVLACVALFLVATFALRGDGHRRLARMLPAMHGGQ